MYTSTCNILYAELSCSPVHFIFSVQNVYSMICYWKNVRAFSVNKIYEQNIVMCVFKKKERRKSRAKIKGVMKILLISIMYLYGLVEIENLSFLHIPIDFYARTKNSILVYLQLIFSMPDYKLRRNINFCLVFILALWFWQHVLKRSKQNNLVVIVKTNYYWILMRQLCLQHFYFHLTWSYLIQHRLKLNSNLINKYLKSNNFI